MGITVLDAAHRAQHNEPVHRAQACTAIMAGAGTQDDVSRAVAAWGGGGTGGDDHDAANQVHGVDPFRHGERTHRLAGLHRPRPDRPRPTPNNRYHLWSGLRV